MKLIKLVYCITKKPGMTREEFLDYWKNAHGPIARGIPGLRRLVQSGALPQQGDVRPPDFDGMAELWFDDIESLLAARKSPAWAASSADEANFIDPARVAYFLAEENRIL